MDSNPSTFSGTATTTSKSAQRVIPLLQSLSRTEEALAALVMRLDPIVNHVPQDNNDSVNSPSVTGRLNQLGDVLQYLLDNIEL